MSIVVHSVFQLHYYVFESSARGARATSERRFNTKQGPTRIQGPCSPYHRRALEAVSFCRVDLLNNVFASYCAWCAPVEPLMPSF